MDMQNYTPIDHLLSTGATPSLGVERQEAIVSPKTFENAPMHEIVEHKPEQEVQEFVEHRPDVIEISPDLQSMGVESTGVSQFTTTQSVTLPLSDNAVITGLKAPYSSSLRWLSEFCLYLLRRAHMHLKMIHGRIMRINDPIRPA